MHVNGTVSYSYFTVVRGARDALVYVDGRKRENIIMICLRKILGLLLHPTCRYIRSVWFVV